PLFAQLHFRKVDAGDAFASQFEDQRFFVIETAVSRNGRQFVFGRRARRSWAALRVHGHRTTSASALAKASQSSSEDVSVAATISRLGRSCSCGIRREAGTPPRMCFSASASTTPAAGFGSFKVNSLKKDGVINSTPLMFESFVASADARA